MMNIKERSIPQQKGSWHILELVLNFICLIVCLLLCLFLYIKITKQLFVDFMNNVDDVDNVDNTSENDISATINIKNELLSMLPKALQNIKNDLESDDATIRGTVSIEIIRLIQSFQE